ncbi:PQQ-dependent sugar dehydrogenase [Pseudoduganella sp. GCM10020061]|uniref:PQQ-dependent sugar dehydrogenase n=1 Tax=Pseudoduganella sp. GCM10020061 TaxID=3317345 RepID=UPI0036454FE9
MPHASKRFLGAILAALALLSTLASCGGSTEIRFGNPPVASTGILIVRITQAPTGTILVIRIAGPNGFSRTLNQGESLTGLTPGSYRISADPVVSGGSTFFPILTPDTVNVVAGATAQVEVRYRADFANLITTHVFLSGLEFPTFLISPPGDARQFITERPGRIRVVRNGALLALPFLDISARVSTAGEGGLLSMAFAPDYASSGVFYIYYTDTGNNIVVERHTVSTNPDRADVTGYLEIIRIPHPGFTNHYGGLVAFGTDGYLYLGTGDGGGAGDPPGNAQNRNVLLGKLLRLDVSQSRIGEPYRIPTGNPFAGQAGARGEIWALGLRNPWRFAFDGNSLVIADVGESRAEEINIVSATRPGVNYGWDILEGSECFGAASCDKTGLETPWIEYTHANGACSITGGLVYRGAALPELAGHYFYSDFCSGFLKSFMLDGISPTPQVNWNTPALGGIVSFGRDGAGELYLLRSNGTIHKIVRAAAP